VVLADTRTAPRMLMPSARHPMICARFSVLKRFILTVMLEASDGIFATSAGDGVMLADMPSVHDVAKYILQQQGSMSTWKLQKLVYYSQAWHYVWEDERLFPEPIEAWADGPVVPALYQEHKGRYTVSESTYKPGMRRNLTEAQRGSIDAVLGFYGDKTGHWLSELTHKEAPWRDARKGLKDNQRSERRITLEAMGRYYAPLQVIS
jgi:uncharacterized phage-associated protein